MTSRPVRLGIQVQPQHALYPKVRDTVRALDDMGVDILFNWDHFFPLSGDKDGLHFEAWTELGSWAELTTNVEFGTLVNCNSYRNPDLQADMARTLDHISGGRFIFGTGSGWFERDYDEYGYEFGTAPERLRALGEALPRIESRLTKLNPGPVNGKLPIMIGGAGPKVTLKLVAKHADWWHSFGDPDVYREKSAILAEHCAREGRDPSEIKRAWGMHTGLMNNVDELADAGVDQIIVGIDGQSGYDLEIVQRLIDWRDSRNG